MALIVALSGSPSASSRTLLLTEELTRRLAGQGFEVALINVRDLPAQPLVFAQADAPGIREPAALVARATGVLIATPVYKSAYSGVLKMFLDLLPQFALQGKTVLPVAVGGTLAHVLSIDYALRPVLASMGAYHITNGYFFQDKQIERLEGGGIRIDPLAEEKFLPVYRDFLTSLRAHETAAAPITHPTGTLV